MIARLRPRRQQDDGASAVELALVLPILMLLIFGIISFGLYFGGALGLSNATREAARYGVVQNRTCEQIAQSLQSTSSGTIGIVYPITFTGTRGSKTCTGSIASTGAITYTSANPSTTVMCADSTAADDELQIVAEAGANIFIPTMTIDMTLNGRGAYRCEFS